MKLLYNGNICRLILPSRRSAPNEKRTKALREIVLARALYSCGDYEGIGVKIIQSYTKDMRGHFARHAMSILNEKNQLPSGVLKIEMK